MKMTIALSSAYAKLERADKHLADLGFWFSNSFINENTHSIIEEVEPNGNHKVLKFRLQTGSVPSQIVATIGDAVHNLRSALDHVACAFALQNNPGVDIGTISFIIVKDGVTFRRPEVQKKIARLGPAGAKFLADLKPYGGDDGISLFYALSRLDNTDKHRALLTTKIYAAGLPNTGTSGEQNDVIFNPANTKWESAENDVVLARWPSSDAKPDVAYISHVAFGESDISDKQPALAILDNIRGLVQFVLWSAEREIAWQ